MDNVIQKWDAWNSEDTPKYPHAKLIQFMFRNFPSALRPSSKVLDLGCGSGVNTKFLCTEGFQVFVSDISAIGIKNTKILINENNLIVEDYRIEAISNLSYPDNYFDCIISIGVMESAGLNETTACAKKISSSLKENAKAFLVFAAADDFRMHNNRLGLYGFEEEEVRNIFSNHFSEVLVDHYITTFDNQKKKQHDFVVTLRK